MKTIRISGDLYVLDFITAVTRNKAKLDVWLHSDEVVATYSFDDEEKAIEELERIERAMNP